LRHRSAVGTVAPSAALTFERVRRVLRHEVVVDVLVPFLASRLGLVLVGYLATNIVVPSPSVPAEWLRPTGHPIVDVLMHWDAHWYLEIVRNGYRVEGASLPGSSFIGDAQSAIAFFPLYPMLGRGVAALLGLGGSDVGRAMALLLVSNAALLGGAIVLHRFLKELYSRAVAARAVLLLLVFPTTVFLSAGYPESLFLALSVVAFHEAWHGRWWTAGLAGAAVALARPFGIVIVLPLALELAMAYRGRDLLRPRSLSLALPFVGLGAWLTFLALTFGDPFAFARVQTGWDRDFGLPWTTFQRFFDEPLTVHRGLQSAVDLSGGILAVALAVVGWRWLRPSHAALLTLVVVSILATGSLLSIWRFLGSLFPIFILLALAARHPVVDRSFRLLVPTVAGLAMALFAQHYWVA
jgi:hypothetical protein